ncbi:hypothetical protein [Vibrio breoganii]|uniref:hypothetical protein n=1 Tax=Vibrio breoganii TaxID=553239 RepID=UPI0039AFBFF7
MPLWSCLLSIINERHLPDKAIDVIDEAGARSRLAPASRRKKTVSVADIESMVAKMASCIPESRRYHLQTKIRYRNWMTA